MNIKWKYGFCILIACLYNCKRLENNELEHKGKKNICFNQIRIDSIRIDAFYTGGDGNFFMTDSGIVFASNYYCSFFLYDLDSFQLKGSYMGKGRGVDEIADMYGAYPVTNEKNTSIVLSRNSYMWTFVDVEKWKISSKRPIMLGMKRSPEINYEAPECYTRSQGEFNFKLTRLNDSLYFFPVCFRIHQLGDGLILNKEHYSKEHIFGTWNINNGEIVNLFGHRPEIYESHPIPHFGSFDYVMSGDTIYTNFDIDSLIYVYKYPDRFLYTIGFECKDIQRAYGESSHAYEYKQLLDTDLKTKGICTFLEYVPETKLLFRGYIKNLATYRTGLQIYKDSDLLGDLDVPPLFKFLGYKAPYYYGVRLLPYETEEDIHFVFYKFRLDSTDNKIYLQI